MKKLKVKMQDLINPTILSHHEIKNIMGGCGGTCRASYYEGGYHFYSDLMTSAEAQSLALWYAMNKGNGQWCCDSCPDL